MSRPSSQHRGSIGSVATSLPVRTSYSRSHSHTASAGSLNGSHRVARRKSSTFSPPTNPALLSTVVGKVVSESSTNGQRRSSMSRAALASLNEGGQPSSLPHDTSLPERGRESAVVDGPSLSSFQGVDRTKPRVRRASDGTRLTKKEKTGTGEVKKCDHCGKSYKHGSCLQKHLWEHTPQWEQTSKYLISKHQQVQILEAASVLVGMNVDGTPITDSDNSSSPPASGSSDSDGELSSAETTPPLHADMAFRDTKRFSNTSSTYSRSYQSVSVFSESAPTGDNGFGHRRHWSTSSSNRPWTAATSITESYDEAAREVAEALSGMKCLGNSPGNRGIVIMDDVPPVPKVPEKWAQEFPKYRAQNDVDMEDDSSSDDEVDEPQERGGNDEIYLFGKMD